MEATLYIMLIKQPFATRDIVQKKHAELQTHIIRILVMFSNPLHKSPAKLEIRQEMYLFKYIKVLDLILFYY